MKSFFLIAVFSLIYLKPECQPLSTPEKHHIIIDTDGGYDDLRTIAILFSSPGIHVKGFILTAGINHPRDSYYHIRELMKKFNKKNIDFAIGDEGEKKRADCPFIEQLQGTIDRPQKEFPSCEELVFGNYKKTGEKSDLICLGPASNIAKLINKEGLIPGINRIIWINEGVDPLSGYNYQYDEEAAEIILESSVRLDIISAPDRDELIFDETITNLVRNKDTELAKYLLNQYEYYDLASDEAYYCKRLLDELVAVFLLEPSLFQIKPVLRKTRVRYIENFQTEMVKEVIRDLISGDYHPSSGIVFQKFPQHRRFYSYDVRPIITTAIKRYGLEEWKACVLTDEIHGHLGIYSIIGAKMGIRAMELLKAGRDELDVLSYAGTTPPYSCINDGIQVSSGSTLGLGKISISDEKKIRPSATFSFRGDTITLSLKEKYLDQVEQDIENGILQYGLLDDGYWKLIRQSAIHYWLEWDRKKIFDIEEGSSLSSSPESVRSQ